MPKFLLTVEHVAVMTRRETWRIEADDPMHARRLWDAQDKGITLIGAVPGTERTTETETIIKFELDEGTKN